MRRRAGLTVPGGEGVPQVMPLEILYSSAFQGRPPRFCGYVGDWLTPEGERVRGVLSELFLKHRHGYFIERD